MEPQYDGQDCIGVDLDSQSCNENPCPGETVMAITGVFINQGCIHHLGVYSLTRGVFIN